jgi:hypothetical protein
MKDLVIAKHRSSDGVLEPGRLALLGRLLSIREDEAGPMQKGPSSAKRRFALDATPNSNAVKPVSAIFSSIFARNDADRALTVILLIF